MENLGEVGKDNRGFQELYKTNNGEYYVISTVNDISAGLDSVNSAIINLGGAFAGYETEGEETIAFVSDSEGNVESWSDEGRIANGEGSRQAVIDMLN